VTSACLSAPSGCLGNMDVANSVGPKIHAGTGQSQLN
jgi:hypothetical protein